MTAINMTIEDITRQLSGTLKPTFQNELEELKKVGTQRDSRRPSKKSRNPDEAMGSDGGEMGNPGTISGKGTKGGMVAVSAMAASNINKKRMGTKRDLDVEASRSLKIPLGSLGSDCNDKVVVNLLEPLQLDLLFELKKRAIKEPKEERVKILSWAAHLLGLYTSIAIMSENVVVEQLCSLGSFQEVVNLMMICVEAGYSVKGKKGSEIEFVKKILTSNDSNVGDVLIGRYAEKHGETLLRSLHEELIETLARGENRPKDIAAVVKDIGKMYWRENQRALNGLVIEYEKGLVSEEGAEDGEWRRYIIYYILFEESSGYWSMIETNKARGIEKIYEEGFIAKIVEKEFKQGFSKIPKNKHMDKSGRVEGDKEEKVEQEEEAQVIGRHMAELILGVFEGDRIFKSYENIKVVTSILDLIVRFGEEVQKSEVVESWQESVLVSAYAILNRILTKTIDWQTLKQLIRSANTVPNLQPAGVGNFFSDLSLMKQLGFSGTTGFSGLGIGDTEAIVAELMEKYQVALNKYENKSDELASSLFLKVFPRVLENVWIRADSVQMRGIFLSFVLKWPMRVISDTNEVGKRVSLRSSKAFIRCIIEFDFLSRGMQSSVIPELIELLANGKLDEFQTCRLLDGLFVMTFYMKDQETVDLLSYEEFKGLNQASKGGGDGGFKRIANSGPKIVPRLCVDFSGYTINVTHRLWETRTNKVLDGLKRMAYLTERSKAEFLRSFEQVVINMCTTIRIITNLVDLSRDGRPGSRGYGCSELASLVFKSLDLIGVIASIGYQKELVVDLLVPLRRLVIALSSIKVLKNQILIKLLDFVYHDFGYFYSKFFKSYTNSSTAEGLQGQMYQTMSLVPNGDIFGFGFRDSLVEQEYSSFMTNNQNSDIYPMNELSLYHKKDGGVIPIEKNWFFGSKSRDWLIDLIFCAMSSGYSKPDGNARSKGTIVASDLSTCNYGVIVKLISEYYDLLAVDVSSLSNTNSLKDSQVDFLHDLKMNPELLIVFTTCIIQNEVSFDTAVPIVKSLVLALAIYWRHSMSLEPLKNKKIDLDFTLYVVKHVVQGFLKFKTKLVDSKVFISYLENLEVLIPKISPNDISKVLYTVFYNTLLSFSENSSDKGKSDNLVHPTAVNESISLVKYLLKKNIHACLEIVKNFY